MLKKKNIAMVMAAATVATSVAPVFAAVTTAKDMADAAQKKEVMDQVKKALDTTYTTDKTKLKTESNAGKSAYEVVVNGKVNGVSVVNKPFTAYDVFAAYMDKMQKDDAATITIKDLGHRVDNGNVLDWDNYTLDAAYKAFKAVEANKDKTLVQFAQACLTDALNDNIIKFGEVRLTDTNVEIVDAAGNIELKEKAGQDVNGNTKQGETLFTFKPSDTMMDFAKPIKTDKGAIIGFENSKENIISKQNDAVIEVKCTEDTTAGAEKVTLDANTLVEDGRLSLKGNEFVKEMKALKEDILVNKEGKKIDLVATKTFAKDSVVEVREEANDGANIKMYTVEESAVKNIDAKTSEYTITVKADLGYAYKNGYKMVANKKVNINTSVAAGVDFKDTTLKVITIRGTHDEVAKMKNDSVEVKTVAGEDRYKTAVEVSKKAFTTTSNVVLVGGEVLADGLTATPLASQKKAPILLTQAGKLNADTKAEIERLGAKNVTIVGGASSVSEAVSSELRSMGVQVDRVYGQDRFETSLEVAKRITTVKTVYVAEGNAMADALSISAVAGEEKQPILLTSKNSMSKDVAKFIEAKNVKGYVIGGSVSKEVSNNLDKITKSSKVLAGSDRYETNAKVLAEFGSTMKDVMLVNGDKGLVDALAAGAYAGEVADTQALVLVGDDLTGAQKLEIKEQKTNIKTKSQVGYGVSLKAVKTLVDLLK